VTAALLGILVLSYGVPFDVALGRLESRYPPVLDVASLQDVRWVVVLGGGQRWRPGIPVSSAPEPSSLYRITEGVRLHRGLPQSRLMFSGGPPDQTMSTARAGAQLAEALGVDRANIVIEERPMSTAEEARLARVTLGNAPFLLVTSAIHMPRAMMLFEREGLHPIPAPTEHHNNGRPGLLPSPVRLADANAVAHELLGMAWARIRPGGGS